MNPFLHSAHDPDERWELRANCLGKAFELFEYQEKDSPLARGMSHSERMDFNDANFHMAEEICIECPVMFKCGAEASRVEKYWTVRGGEAPKRHAEEKQRYANVGRPPGAKNKIPPGPKWRKLTGVDRICQRGHTVVGGGRCPVCKRTKNTARQREVRKAAKSGKVETTEKPTG